MTPRCPVCDDLAQFDLYHPDADLYRCPGCGHCFSHLETLRNTEEYGPEYFQETHSKWFAHSHDQMYNMLANGIRKHCPSTASVLDVGCGNAKFLRFLRSRESWDLTGIDLSAQTPVDGIELIQGNFNSFDPDTTFDVVTSVMVVEHLDHLSEHLDRMTKLCRPGGLLVVLTINERSILYLTARLLRFFGYTKPYDRLYSIHHLNHFNSDSLRTWLDSRTTVLEQVHHNVPMDALDIPAKPGPLRVVQWLGVWFTFQLGKLTKRTYSQTIFCRTPKED